MNAIAKVERPSVMMFLTEPGRAVLDLGKLWSMRHILEEAPPGDGHPVMVLPGFMTGDSATFILRKFIKKCGYKAVPWGLGRNLGQFEDPAVIYEQLQRLNDQYGEKISLVGWSLGGVYAREVARNYPDNIRCVVTLGSPFGGVTEDNNAAWLFELIHGKKVTDINSNFLKDLHLPPPVPSTAIYTKSDGVVAWQHCRDEYMNGHSENIEIRGSHWGLGHNPAALICIADRLSQKEDKQWQKFDPQGWARGMFPNL